MGSYSSHDQEPDLSFLHENGHKTYVVTSSLMEFIKIGYTKQPITNGVWSIYRRAYGEDLEIIRVYPAKRYKEDDLIHAKLGGKYGVLEKGNEIYHKKHLKSLLKELDSWHEKEGVGPFKRVDILTMNAEGRENRKKEEELLGSPKIRRKPRKKPQKPPVKDNTK